jgi:multidrug efflux system membrane fusion protein
MNPLSGKNTRLRAIEPADLDIIYEWENDPENWIVSNTIAPFSRHVLQKYIEGAQQDIYEARQLRLMIDMLESDKAELVRAELDLANMVVRAPFDGMLQEREVEIGDFVRSGDPIATFIDNSTLLVIGTLAEQEIANIKVGETARASLVTGQEVQGRVRYLAPVADESTRTFNVEIEIDNADGTLPAGVTAEMKLEGSKSMAHQLSPALLTLDPAGELGVYVVDEMQQANFVRINIERSGTDGVWVSGLPETSDVIIVGQGYVNPGQRVTPVRAPTETAVATGPAS